MQFDRAVLESLPLPDDDTIRRVLTILRALVHRRLLPYFKNSRGTNPLALARVSDHLTIQRYPDDDNLTPLVSFLTRTDGHWDIHIHERVFDYLAFVIPSDPEAKLGGQTPEESQVLAFAEFLLRHQMEHVLYGDESEREVTRSDVLYAMDQRENDPTFYRMLRKVLAEEMNGLKGELYLAAFDAAEQDRPFEYLLTRLLHPLPSTLITLPEHQLLSAFTVLDRELKSRLLDELYQRSREPAYPLLRRVAFLETLLRLFGPLMKENEKEAQEIFRVFKDRWGLVYLFRELGLPEVSVEEKEFEDLFALFQGTVREFLGDEVGPAAAPALPTPAAAEKETAREPSKTLKERIEEARNDPLFSRQAMEVIDKNRTSAVGHSGAKYTELIETLLAIPWGSIARLEVTTESFEEGLNRTHYGLQKPKEMICDFFTNLIWRYHQLAPGEERSMKRTGSAFLFVGPPGVGKTSLAISIATHLQIPYHKVSLGGMRDEADLRGHGFTYEGSKPGAIVQGLIKMGIMNGMFIMDEADKTEKFAVSTLLEILDPEQNHLFHDKYIMSTVDIDLSNCHFILTANTLETVPAPVVNRCEVINLGRYAVEEKVAIGRDYLVQRVRKRYEIGGKEIFFEPGEESNLLRYLIKTYTHEPGVRELERIIRTLFLRLLRKEILTRGEKTVQITRQKIRQYLETPTPPRRISEEDRIGEAVALGINVEQGIGSIIPIQATAIRSEEEAQPPLRGHLSMVHATGNIEKIMDESRRVATTGILFCADQLGIDLAHGDMPIHLHFMGASTRKDGPSAGAAIALALASTLTESPIRRDVAVTGEIDTQGRILGIGGLDIKLEVAYDAGCKTVIIPRENMLGEEGIERLPEAFKRELQVLTYEEWQGKHQTFDYEHHMLQVVAVDHIVHAAHVAFVQEAELRKIEKPFVAHARSVLEVLKESRKEVPSSTCCVVYAKTAAELGIAATDEAFWKKFGRVFVVRPRDGEEAAPFPSGLKGHAQFRFFDPEIDSFPALIHEIQKNLGRNLPLPPERMSIIAPYFFLQSSGICSRDFLSKQPFRELRLLANNYSVQGVKMKRCKPLLNLLHLHLALMPGDPAHDCEFLAQRDNVTCTDLSFIPEKYRLDVKRAEEIFNRGLGKWMETVDPRWKAFQKARSGRGQRKSK